MSSKDTSSIDNSSSFSSVGSDGNETASQLLNKDNEKYPYVCTVSGCSKRYTRSDHLKRHISSTHSPDKKHFTCSVTGCGRVYTSSTNLKRHLKTHLDSCPYKCDQEGCGQEFKKRQRLLTHLSLTHKLKQFKCTVDGCDAVFSLPSELKRHLKRHSKQYVCDKDDCSVVCSSWSLLRKHKAEDHKPSEACTICGLVPATSKQLQKHIESHSTTTQELFQCPYTDCSRTYTTKFNLQQHVSSFHENLRPFACRQSGCSAEFAHKNSLTRHLIKAHGRKSTESLTTTISIDSLPVGLEGIGVTRLNKKRRRRTLSQLTLAERISGHVGAKGDERRDKNEEEGKRSRGSEPVSVQCP